MSMLQWELIKVETWFEDLGMTTIWCGYYDGNNKSKRAQEKMGFRYHHTCDEVPVTLLNEVRVGHTNYMTLEMWKNRIWYSYWVIKNDRIIKIGSSREKVLLNIR